MKLAPPPPPSQIYNSTKSENLKATTASTLGRLLHYSPTLVAYVIDKFGVRLFVTGLTDSSSKVQTAAVNMLNMMLCQPDLSMRAKAALSEERSLVSNIMALLEHSMPLLRAKGIVAILLLCRWVGGGGRGCEGVSRAPYQIPHHDITT